MTLMTLVPRMALMTLVIRMAHNDSSQSNGLNAAHDDQTLMIVTLMTS